VVALPGQVRKSVGSKVSGVRDLETLCLVLAQDVTDQQQLASELAAKCRFNSPKPAEDEFFVLVTNLRRRLPPL